MSSSNRGDVTPDAEIYCLGKYRVVASSEVDAEQEGVDEENIVPTTMAWKCFEAIEGIGDVFTGYEFSGEQDWNDDSINLTHPDNAEMTVKFRVPDDPSMLESESTDLFFLIGLNWLSETDECKFEVEING